MATDMECTLLRDSLNVQRELSKNMERLSIATETNTQVTLELKGSLSNGAIGQLKRDIARMKYLLTAVLIPLLYLVISSITNSIGG